MSAITTYCRITDQGYRVEEKPLELLDGATFPEKVTSLYKKLDLAYPKFHKMDLLSKTAVLGVELLLKERPGITGLKDDELAIFFGNSESSEYSDKKFYESYTEKENPSPSHFVYTLPNILIGEIAIKNKWYGENLFLIFPKFDAREFYEQVEVLLNNGSKGCICGWVDVSQEKIDAFFFIVEKEADRSLTPEILVELYQKNHARH